MNANAKKQSVLPGVVGEEQSQTALLTSKATSRSAADITVVRDKASYHVANSPAPVRFTLPFESLIACTNDRNTLDGPKTVLMDRYRALMKKLLLICVHAGWPLVHSLSPDIEGPPGEDLLRGLDDCLKKFAANTVPPLPRGLPTEQKIAHPVGGAANSEDPPRKILAGLEKMQTYIVRCLVYGHHSQNFASCIGRAQGFRVQHGTSGLLL